MNHKTDIGFVYAHTERHRGTYHLHTVVDKIILCPLALFSRKPGMVGHGCYIMPTKHLRHAFGGLLAQAIYDSAIVGMPGDKFQYGTVLVFLLIPAFHVKTEVRTVERRNEHDRIGQSQLLLYILPSQTVGRSGQCHDRHIGKRLPQQSQLGILRPEIMPPLRDTVRFVHCKQGYFHVPYQIRKLQHQAFGRNIQQFQLPSQTGRTHPGTLCLVIHAVQCRRRHSIGPQSLHLVFHQGYQRRYHDCRPFPHQRRNLITQALPATGRHEHHDIMSGQNIPDDVLL